MLKKQFTNISHAHIQVFISSISLQKLSSV
nr:MAG TPA: hypothetical protein [Caudoviricetes sp.]